jgi:hypothetical protein
VARKADFPLDSLRAESEPFSLTIGDAVLTDGGMRGTLDDVAWELSWEPRLGPADHVHPLLRRAGLAQTVLTLAHPDLEVHGSVCIADEEVTLDGARGGQAHLWGSRHAQRWTWAHCNDFEGLDGSPRSDTFVDGVSVVVRRAGREIGPSTPVVARIAGRDFRSVGLVAVTRNPSRFGLTGWRLVARDGDRRLVADVDADPGHLVGVTYHDPDGTPAYCYNGETATMRLQVWDRSRRAAAGRRGWRLTDELVAPRRAHFEYAQREPLPEPPLLIR